MIKKIKVKNSGIIKLKSYDDFPDGHLIIGEYKKNIPFQIKRVYYINSLFNKNAIRGKHAHKKLQQVLFCINGYFTLNLDDGKNKQSILMSDPEIGIKIGPRLWHTMEKFSPDCVILVLAGDFFKPSDYIRNYNDFKKYIDRKQNEN